MRFKNVATVFGKTHIKDENGQHLFLNGFDCDSEFVYDVLTTILDKLQISLLLKSKVQDLIDKSGGRSSDVKCLLDYLKQVTVVVKTRKPYGLHFYWLSHNQNKLIRAEDCKPRYQFEIKTDKGSGHATLPPSTHRHDKNFRYYHIGCTKQIQINDELYHILIELFHDYLVSSPNSKGNCSNIGSSTDIVNRNERIENRERTERKRPSSGKQQQHQESFKKSSNIILYNLSEKMIEASVAYLVPYYTEHYRNAFTLSFGGATFYAKISQESATKILTEICKRTGDSEIRNRIQTLHNTYEKALSGKEDIIGAPTLADLISKIKGIDIDEANRVVGTLKALWHEDIKVQKSYAYAYSGEQKNNDIDNNAVNSERAICISTNQF